MGNTTSSKKIKSLAVILAISLILIIVGIVIGLDDCGVGSSKSKVAVDRMYTISTVEGKRYEYLFESTSSTSRYIYVSNAVIDSIYYKSNGNTYRGTTTLVSYDYSIDGTNFDRLYKFTASSGIEYEITFIAESDTMKFIIS